MKTRLFLLNSCAAILLSTGIAHAGPCNTTANKDAGSGPTSGRTTGQTTTGIAPRSGEHPPTASMNNAAGDTAASSQDAQRQMQGKPTAAREAQGTKGKAGNDC